MLNRSTEFLAVLCHNVLPNKQKLASYYAMRRTAVNFGAVIFTLFLTGCVTKNGQSPLETLSQVVVPEVKVTDYRYASCDTIWDNDEPVARENALFWLRMMDCADRVDITQARNDATQITVTDWSTAFQQNILLNAADPTTAERRKMLDSINTYSLSFPTAVRPLLQLWREQQVQIINLSDAGVRYKRLQQEMDSKLDRLKEDNAKLAFELSTTSRKLENLTDIERQLSSRKKSTNETEKEVESTVEGEKMTAPNVQPSSDATGLTATGSAPNDKP
ncbi:two-component system QseEF-associated lipoprotein QseG [Providencia sp. Me31A]|uniref:two-component system QseEF-associated lipoprotein QseG n=1 Tax=Providencia sp. Me31A TaxID=3392637 RepID=UPI003D2C562D